jgi:hypothetical protein
VTRQMTKCIKNTGESSINVSLKVEVKKKSINISKSIKDNGLPHMLLGYINTLTRDP